MSRNLASTHCAICGERPELVEAPRPVRADELGFHRERYLGNLVVANADCPDCGARYLAWVSHNFPPSSTFGSTRWVRKASGRGAFVDLSFRSTFDDEPGPGDLPTPEKLREIHRRARMQEAAALRESAARLLEEAANYEHDAEHGDPHYESYRRLR